MMLMPRILKTALMTVGIGILSFIFVMIYGFLSTGFCYTGMPQIYATMFAGSIMCILSILIYNKIPKNNTGADSPRITGRMFGIVLILILLFTYCSLTVSVWIAAHLVDTGMAARSDTIGNVINETGILPYVFYSVIAAPIIEEIIYRLCMYNFSKCFLPVNVSIVLTGIVFGLSHMTVAHAVIGTLFGIFLTLVYEFTGRRLVMCIFCHMYYNFISIFSPMSWYLYNNDIISVLCFMAAMAIVLFLYKFVFLDKRNVSRSHTNNILT